MSSVQELYKVIMKQKEEIMIGNDVLRLEVRRLRDLLSAKADVVFSLENRKQQLLLSMEERYSLTHLLTHSPTHSLTHSLTYSLTHLLTHSLTHQKK